MTTADIQAMAREAGLVPMLSAWDERVAHQEWKSSAAALARFAELVRADERERCAKVCDRRVVGDHNREDAEAARCAEAIRALPANVEKP